MSNIGILIAVICIYSLLLSKIIISIWHIFLCFFLIDDFLTVFCMSVDLG